MSEPIIPVLAVCETVIAHMQTERKCIEDVFYDYKDDEDLDFNLYFDFPEAAERLTTNLEKLDYVEASCNASMHVMGGTGRIVTITLAHLLMKDVFIDLLRKEWWS